MFRCFDPDDGLNQYTSAGPAAFSYDGKGNLTSDGTRTYSYDAENRLVTPVSGGVTTNLTYDPLGRLFQVDQGTSATTTRFLYDGAQLAAEYDGSNAMTKRYYFGPGEDEPILEDTGGALNCSGTKFLHTNQQGSIIALADCWGNRSSINSYDEYGIPGSANSGRFQYTGQMWLSELGMYYYKNRIYSPTLGRFLQTDPIGYDGDGPNLYAYVLNDPVNFSDPLGLTLACVTGPGVSGGVVVLGSSVTSCGDVGFGMGAGASVAGGGPSFNLALELRGSDSQDQDQSSDNRDKQQGNPICPLNRISDVLGKLQALPATAVGLLVGYVAGFTQELAGGPAVHIGLGNNAIQFTGFAGGSPVGLTLGNVQLYGAGTGPGSRRGRYDGGAASGAMGTHEEAHTYQWQSNSPASWAYAYIKYGFSSRNRFELQADDYADKGPRCY